MRAYRYSDAEREQIRALADGSRSAQAIGDAVGLSRKIIITICRKERIELPTALAARTEAGKRGWAKRALDPAALEAHREASRLGGKVRQRTRAVRRQAAPAVPRWVPHDMRQDYVDNTRLYGEEHAASLARRMKQEAMQA